MQENKAFYTRIPQNTMAKKHLHNLKTDINCNHRPILDRFVEKHRFSSFFIENERSFGASAPIGTERVPGGSRFPARRPIGNPHTGGCFIGRQVNHL